MEGFIKNTLYPKVAEKLKPEIFEQGLSKTSIKILEGSNIKALYTLQEDDPLLFKENRNRLNTERGLVIANHPGFYDTFLILATLERKDIRLVVSESNFEKLIPILGEELLINAKSTHILRDVQQSIDAGGLVVMYPTAGSDRVDKKDTEVSDFNFKRGFSLILNNLNPGDMVYSFYIEPQGIANIIGELIPRDASLGSAILTHQNLNINNLKQEQTIPVYEHYSQASEWQEIIEQADLTSTLSDPKERKQEKEVRRAELDKSLANHFLKTTKA